MTDERAENRQRFPVTAALVDMFRRAGFEPVVIYCEENGQASGLAHLFGQHGVQPFIPAAIVQAIEQADAKAKAGALPAGRSRPYAPQGRRRSA